MAVGQGALVSHMSYLAVARETVLAAWVTATEGLHFLSANFKTSVETKIIESVETSRSYGHSIQLGKVVEAEVEWAFSARTKASSWILINAFGGGAVSSATTTGETVGAGILSSNTHIVSLNNFDATYSSLSFVMRKGDTTTGKVFGYSGGRVNEFSLVAEIDEPIKATASMVLVDSTTTVNDVVASVSTIKQRPLSFVNARFSAETSFSSLTTSSFWHVQSINFTLNNNLKSDSESRRVGSNLLNVIPAGVAQIELSCMIRYDTLTAYTAMLNASTLTAEFEFLGPTFASSTFQEGLKIQFPNLRVLDSGDPEIGGPDGILQSEVTFAVLRDVSSAGGYAVRAILTNTIASYA